MISFLNNNMILVFLICALLFIIFNDSEKFTDENNLKIINEKLVPNKKCFYNGNELFIGKKYIQKLSDNKFYNICEYNLDKNKKCSAPCLLLDEKCNTTKDPVSLSLNKKGESMCRTKSKLI